MSNLAAAPVPLRPRGCSGRRGDAASREAFDTSAGCGSIAGGPHPSCPFLPWPMFPSTTTVCRTRTCSKRRRTRRLSSHKCLPIELPSGSLVATDSAKVAGVGGGGTSARRMRSPLKTSCTALVAGPGPRAGLPPNKRRREQSLGSGIGRLGLRVLGDPRRMRAGCLNQINNHSLLTPLRPGSAPNGRDGANLRRTAASLAARLRLIYDFAASNMLGDG